MKEKTVTIMKGAGALNLVTGILTLISGVTMGVLLLVNGARLLKNSNDMII